MIPSLGAKADHQGSPTKSAPSSQLLRLSRTYHPPPTPAKILSTAVTALPSVSKIPKYILAETDWVVCAFHSRLLTRTFIEYL